MGDWRLQGQERFLKGAELRWATYTPWREDWEHDHCEFCTRTLSTRAGDLNAGYVTKNGYHWICESCYKDFKDTFGWTVTSETG